MTESDLGAMHARPLSSELEPERCPPAWKAFGNEPSQVRRLRGGIEQSVAHEVDEGIELGVGEYDRREKTVRSFRVILMSTLRVRFSGSGFVE